MAKIKFGQIISEARGKIAGMVFSRNGSCSYIRQKVTPINPNTGYQSGVRTSLASAAKAWSGLTANQRAQWESAKMNGNKKNSIGDTVTLSGFNYFVSIYRNLFSIGYPAPTDYPGNVSGLPAPEIVSVIPIAPPLWNIELSLEIDLADRGLLFATPPLSPGKSFVKSEYRLIKILKNADGVEINIGADYIAKFGRCPVAGEQVFLKIQSFNTTSGKAGAALAKAVK